MTTDLFSLRESVINAARNCTDVARLQAAYALLQSSTTNMNPSANGTLSGNTTTDSGSNMSREDFLKKLRGG